MVAESWADVDGGAGRAYLRVDERLAFGATQHQELLWVRVGAGQRPVTRSTAQGLHSPGRRLFAIVGY